MININGELVLEPNPYLSEWTMKDDDFSYFQLVLGKILDHFSLLTYSDDADSVKYSFSELLITQTIIFQDPKDDDWAYSYLEKVKYQFRKKRSCCLNYYRALSYNYIQKLRDKTSLPSFSKGYVGILFNPDK